MNAYITDYALRHKTPIIPLGDSLRDAMAKMGIPIGGSNGNERQRELMRLASKIESKKEFYRSTIQLVLIAVLLVIGYYCRRRLRFTANGLNFSFICAYCALPFFILRPLLCLGRWAKTLGMICLTPLLVISSFLLLTVVTFGGLERTQPLKIFQLKSSTVELQRWENGGAIGIHGLNLEQRRTLLPGLYLIKAIYFFDLAGQGTLSVEGIYKVKVHVIGSYHDSGYEVDRTCQLKEWLYF